MPFKHGSNNVYIYDSLTSKPPRYSLINTTCSFFKCEWDSIHFDVVNVQRQSNHYDCGLFAIAYAVELAHGKDPAKYDWDSSLFRKDLISCFKKKIDCFPKSKTRTVRLGQRILKSKKIHLFCECRMPMDESKATIRCCSCKKSFHTDCMSLKTCFEQWICMKCLEILTPPQY